jgi:HEPN domain-containing protein
MDRTQDWVDQAHDDHRHAKNALATGDSSWACQQAAEKAVKAVFPARRMVGWGHVILRLLEELRSEVEIPEALFGRARRLDQYYVLIRYPNGFDAGKPSDYYDRNQAEEAIRDAEDILAFCEGAIGSPGRG